MAERDEQTRSSREERGIGSVGCVNAREPTRSEISKCSPESRAQKSGEAEDESLSRTTPQYVKRFGMNEVGQTWKFVERNQ